MMSNKIEVWPKIIALSLIVLLPFLLSSNPDNLIWLVVLLSIIQIYILLVNDERIFDIHKRLRELEEQEEDKKNHKQGKV
jgi:hypothetical protein